MIYKIVTAGNETLMVEAVNKLIKEGWVPQGGIATDQMGMYQAMVYMFDLDVGD